MQRKTPYRLCQIGVELLLLVWSSQLTPLLIAFNVYVRDERKSKCTILACNSECFCTKQLFQIQKYFPKIYLRNVQVSYIRIYAYMHDVPHLCNSSRCMQQCKLFIIHVVYSIYSA